MESHWPNFANTTNKKVGFERITYFCYGKALQHPSRRPWIRVNSGIQISCAALVLCVTRGKHIAQSLNKPKNSTHPIQSISQLCHFLSLD